MKSRLNLLTINRVIIHQIPKNLRRTETQPLYSEVESPLDSGLKLLFTERINSTASSQSAYKVELDPAADSVTPSLVQEFLTGKSLDFVEMSKMLAKHLYETQSAVNSDGLLTVVDCALGSLPGLCIIKLEKEEGARLQQSLVDGRTTFNIEHLRDIMLTGKTRLYKLGLFAPSRSGSSEIVGLACDEQRGYRPRVEIASFFLKKFLGCRLLLAPSVATKRFFEETERFINASIVDPVRKAECMNHLVSELTNQRNIVNPQAFALNNFTEDERRAYLAAVGEQITAENFEKDVVLIEGRIRKMVMEFASGIQIVGLQKMIDDKVKLTAVGDGRTKAELVDELKQVRTRS